MPTRNTFVEALNVDEMVGQLLASEGFTDLEEVAYVEPDEIAMIEGFDDETAGELQARAKEFLEKQEAGTGRRAQGTRCCRTTCAKCRASPQP